MRLRIWLGVIAATVGLCAFVGSAWACLGADLTTSPNAGPGDPVSFSIAGIGLGANYTVTLQGQDVASGTNTTNDNGVSGSFTMPDLGRTAQTVYAEADTFHPDDGDSFHLTSAIAYQPPASPPPVSSSRPAPSQSAPAGTRSRSGHSDHPQTTATPTKSASDRVVGTEAVAAGAPVMDAGRDSSSATDSAAKSTANEHPQQTSSSVPNRVLHALGSSTTVGPAKVPTIGLLFMALIFIGGTALAACLVYLSQTGPDPRAALKAPAPLPEDPVEAELQEMIADGMARQLLADLELGESVSLPD